MIHGVPGPLMLSFHKRREKASSSERIELRSEFVRSTSVLMLQCGNSATIWTDESETEMILLQHWGLTEKWLGVSFFEPKLVFVSQPEHCYLSSGFSNSLLFELIPDGAGAVSSMERRKCVCMAIFTLEKDYSSETGYPLDSSRQIDKTSWFENMIRFLHQMETREKIRAPYGIRTHDPPRSFVGSNPIWASDVFPSFCWCKKRIMFYFLFYWCCKKELVVHT